MTIGVGVEGPSDRAFWDKLLHKNFPKLRFDIRSMNNREKLIRAAPSLLETFRDLHYRAGFIILDRDQSPCIASIMQEFDPQIQQEVRKPPAERYLFVCVAIRELEAWFLADDAAILAVLPRAKYRAPSETGQLNAQKILTECWLQQFPHTAFNKLDFAKRIAPKFKPDIAARHSASFKYFWERMKKRRRA
ncbi:MAG: DUF4276 family protein [candidate division KSB1 bacterium]